MNYLVDIEEEVVNKETKKPTVVGGLQGTHLLSI